MAKKMGTQDRIKARQMRAALLRSARIFDGSDDLGDRADRYGPELVQRIKEPAALEGWEA